MNLWAPRQSMRYSLWSVRCKDHPGLPRPWRTRLSLRDPAPDSRATWLVCIILLKQKNRKLNLQTARLTSTVNAKDLKIKQQIWLCTSAFLQKTMRNESVTFTVQTRRFFILYKQLCSAVLDLTTSHFLAAGYPDPEVVWLCGDLPVEESSTVQIEYEDDGCCTLILSKVVPEDTNVYTCKATNDHGEMLCSAKLTVLH